MLRVFARSSGHLYLKTCSSLAAASAVVTRSSPSASRTIGSSSSVIHHC